MSAQIEIRSLSSLEKCFLDDRLCEKEEITSFSVLRGERLSFQIGLCRHDPLPFKTRFILRLSGALAPYAKARRVVNLPCHYPCIATNCDEHYLRREPGFYPDLLRPLHYDGQVTLPYDQPQAIWVDISLPVDYAEGTYDLTVEVLSRTDGEVVASKTVTVRALGTSLPPQRLIHTEWFYTDCLANYYRTRAFSERHWRIIENFLRTAVESGINMILTPIFTPELDTEIGGERLTTQLLGITVVGKNQYEFDFSQVGRWIDLCLSVGVRYFEIPHFFTQWGATHAPKFVARVNGRSKRIFGWETDACGEEYKLFLGQMIPALIAFLKEKGVADNTFFHISDEPHLKDMEQYLRCKNVIEPLIGDCPIIDALSDFAFYESGVLKKPVPHVQRVQTFLDAKVEGLWAYYCGDSGRDASGRLLAMPLSRTRILGVQLWLYNIEGFLHWGYNFYNNENSHESVDPYLHTDGEYFVPSGDTCLVYPGDDGEAYESLRLVAMREAMEDMRLLDLCSARLGRERVETIVAEEAGETITFLSYPRDTNFLLRLRDRLLREAEVK